jgi:hypothetical protein
MMADVLTIMNNGAPIKVRELLSEKKIKKDGTIEKAKFGDIIEIPTGAIQLNKLTAEMVLNTYKERCSIVSVSSAVKGDSKEIEKLQKELSAAAEKIAALEEEKAALEAKVAELSMPKEGQGE